MNPKPVHVLATMRLGPQYIAIQAKVVLPSGSDPARIREQEARHFFTLSFDNNPRVSREMLGKVVHLTPDKDCLWIHFKSGGDTRNLWELLRDAYARWVERQACSS